MRTYTITYYHLWSQFSWLSTAIKANNEEQALIRFYASKESDNCQHIIQID